MSDLSHKLQKRVTDLLTTFVPLRKGDNKGSYLADIWVAQEIERQADKALAQAWKRAQDDGVVADDDEMRALGVGDHLVSESNDFSVTAKVAKGREIFYKGVFIAAVSKKYKIDIVKLNELAEKCVSNGKLPLTKRVVEAPSVATKKVA
jgi:hypothetical protein